jgi:RNA polymerase sigma-70 factor, ECF subfamily
MTAAAPCPGPTLQSNPAQLTLGRIVAEANATITEKARETDPTSTTRDFRPKSAASPAPIKTSRRGTFSMKAPHWVGGQRLCGRVPCKTRWFRRLIPFRLALQRLGRQKMSKCRGIERTMSGYKCEEASDRIDAWANYPASTFRGFHGFSGTDAKPWLLAIVRNAAYRWFSNRRRSANVISLEKAVGGPGEESAEAQIASEDPTPEAQLIGEVDRGLVRSALVELPPIFREVIMLREIEGLTYREISQVTGAPLGTVMSRLARGRGELRKALSRMMEKDKPHAV